MTKNSNQTKEDLKDCRTLGFTILQLMSLLGAAGLVLAYIVQRWM